MVRRGICIEGEIYVLEGGGMGKKEGNEKEGREGKKQERKKGGWAPKSMTRAAKSYK